ncbi:MAG: lysine--tRNA ligase, partial [Dokdonella sp.]|nr:lysine--tRNA ligase [Dokdonella sp.]
MSDWRPSASPDALRLRARLNAAIRAFFAERGVLEVETPILSRAGNTAANIASFSLEFSGRTDGAPRRRWLRTSPEPAHKRLLAAGIGDCYELGRVFRDGEVGSRHNPEFTMLELYEAYATYNEIMDLTENLIRDAAGQVLGTTQMVWEGADIDLGPAFRRWRMDEAVRHHNPGLSVADCTDREALQRHCATLGIRVKPSWGWGKLLLEVFEATVEHTLVQPTFITDHPVEVSPLARASDSDPGFTDRFELFVNGKELANGFSELNDPEDQAARFRAQVDAKAGGDDEAMHFDADYIRALEVGLAPTGGLGIGIDRLVMLLTGSDSIRDVLLFPYMRPQP